MPGFWRQLFSNDHPVILAGPCAIENKSMYLQTARKLKEMGVHGLRGGVFKPRTSPYSFQGVGKKGLPWIKEAKEQTGLVTITEVMSPEQVGPVSEYADILQIGSRSMQNYPLLKEVGKTDMPVLLKRGMGSRLEELFYSAEYICSMGNTRIIFCERGIRTFETWTRFTFDINAIPIIKKETNLPIIADPSHGVGISKYVPSVALAALAAGADGILIEVHPCREVALSDGMQSLDFSEFEELLQRIHQLFPQESRLIQ
ncbi:MAG: 3-deoxy-7-phosphoheptulonate synthase [Planctomycetota bacterium]|nr:MAG: 3-deoxy-7-phosphoheptulonate synthase [Planctomycetota bacterium]